MTHYQVKKSNELSAIEIQTILNHWGIEEWKQLNLEEFKHKFVQSEFHLLLDNQNQLLCIARINFDFRLQINAVIYKIAELVGLVAIRQDEGFAKELLYQLKNNLQNRKIEAIGFCEKNLRTFYEKCGITVMYDKAKLLRESSSDEWVIPTDDDIVDLTLSKKMILIFESLSAENLAYLLFE